MKKVWFTFCLIMLGVTCFSQTKLSFKPLRYDEDYSFLKKDTAASWYKKTKYTSLSRNGNTYVSFGGEVRFQYFYTSHEDWGDTPQDKDGYILTRFLGHADFHAGRHFRTFIQLQSSNANSKESVNPVDDNPLEIHQAFVDVNLSTGNKSNLIFRVGRQELSYGSQRLISVRELPNNRQSFDGIKAMFSTGKYKADVFYTNYVLAKQGIFDDAINKNTRLWGAYLMRKKIVFLENIDLYYLGLWKKQTSFDDGKGKEMRHSVGSRIFGNKKKWVYDVEGVYQWGEFGIENISAWTASTNISYDFNLLDRKSLIGFKTEYISGDRNYNDGKLNTFNPLFPRGAYFGQAALIGPSNLFDIHPYLEVDITKKLSFQPGYDVFWRASRNDGIYAINVKQIYSGKNASSRYIGRQLDMELIYTPTPFLYIKCEFTLFSAAEYLKQVSAGKNILLTGATMQVKF